MASLVTLYYCVVCSILMYGFIFVALYPTVLNLARLTLLGGSSWRKSSLSEYKIIFFSFKFMQNLHEILRIYYSESRVLNISLCLAQDQIVWGARNEEIYFYYFANLLTTISGRGALK